MDNYQQPNGGIPRPQSRSRPQPVQRMNPDSDDDDFLDEGVGPILHHAHENGGIGGPPTQRQNMVPAQAPVRVPSSRNRNREEQTVRRSNSRDKDLVTPKFLKIAIVGDSWSGKSCICQSVTSESYTFNKNYQLTPGVQVYSKSVRIPDASDDGSGDASSSVMQALSEERLNIALLDTSGKDIYVEYLPKYWEKIDGFAIIIDLTSPNSLTNASEWLQLVLASVKENMSGNNNLLGVLIGNKMDLVDRRVINPLLAQEFANKNGLQYFECSVKDSSGLEEPFFYLAHKWKTLNPADKN